MKEASQPDVNYHNGDSSDLCGRCFRALGQALKDYSAMCEAPGDGLCWWKSFQLGLLEIAQIASQLHTQCLFYAIPPAVEAMIVSQLEFLVKGEEVPRQTGNNFQRFKMITGIEEKLLNLIEPLLSNDASDQPAQIVDNQTPLFVSHLLD